MPFLSGSLPKTTPTSSLDMRNNRASRAVSPHAERRGVETIETLPGRLPASGHAARQGSAAMKRHRSARANANRGKPAGESASAILQTTNIRSSGSGVALDENPVAIASRVIPLLLIGVGLAAYHNSFRGVFLLDDQGRIVDEPKVQ